MKAIGLHIVIKPEEKESEVTTASGIVLNQKIEKKANCGVVHSIGYEAQSRELKEGHTVYYNPHTAQKIVVNGEDWYICEYEDILATA